MPMGYNTLVGDMGTVLSGGQARVLLARAQAAAAAVPGQTTSHLDIARERVVPLALARDRGAP